MLSATKMKEEVRIAILFIYWYLFIHTNFPEDIKAAKQYVQSLLKALLAYSRTILPTTSTSPASSSAAPPPPESEEELDKARIETMKLLTEVLQRNIRVRFDLNMDELMEG